MIDPDGFRPNVGIILIRDDGRVFWARRVNRDGWQFPQGGMRTDETPLEAMYRELEEETGWTADHAEVLMIGPTSSGASSEKIAFVRATGLRRIGDGGGDDSEDITVHEIPRAQAAAWLVQKMGEGYELDAKLWAGLWMIEHHLDGRPRG